MKLLSLDFLHQKRLKIIKQTPKIKPHTKNGRFFFFFYFFFIFGVLCKEEESDTDQRKKIEAEIVEAD